MAELGVKIRELREGKGLSRRAFADSLDVQEGKIQKIEIGDQRADHEFLSKLAKRYEIDLNLLLTDESVTAPNTPTPLYTDLVEIPFLSSLASAGFGSNVEGEHQISTYPVSLTWLNAKGLNPSTLSCVPVSGDSMEPELSDGDLILVDTRTPSLVDGKMYAVRYSDSLFVKRVQVRPKRHLRLSSTNTFYDPIDVENPEADGLSIVGQVVASIREM